MSVHADGPELAAHIHVVGTALGEAGDNDEGDRKGDAGDRRGAEVNQQFTRIFQHIVDGTHGGDTC